MADEPISPIDTPLSPEQPVPDDADVSRRIRRPVYEPTLLPPRKRRRASPWVIIPALLLVLGAILYVVLALPRQRRLVTSVGQVAYSSDQGTPGHSHIWVVGPDGAGAHRLTSSTADETSPAWPADGSQLAFLSNAGGATPQVFVADADGQDLRPVTRNAGAKTQPQFAPSDSSLLGYTAGGAFCTVDVPTGQTVRLLPTVSESSRAQNTDEGGAPAQPPTITAFSWNPVKERARQGVAAVEDLGRFQALVLLPTLDDKPRDVRPDGAPLAAADTLTPGWSPDGALLAVALDGVAGLPAGREASALLLYDAQGNAVGQRPLAIYRGAGVGPEHPVFSPDGTQIVWEVWTGQDLAHRRSAGLIVAPIDGSAPPRPLYQGSAEKVQFARDGRSLYFRQARPDGGHDLCRVGTDGDGFIRLSDGRSDVLDLAVSPQQVPH